MASPFVSHLLDAKTLAAAGPQASDEVTMSTIMIEAEESGFWRRQFAPQPTAHQIIFCIASPQIFGGTVPRSMCVVLSVAH